MSLKPPNPFMALDAAAIDVLDDMVQEWLDRDRHGELDYGKGRTDALSLMYSQVQEAWKAKVNWRDVRELD
ncbi:gp17 [Streptomyces phage phiBT1]|uniref:Gp17 n=1 Tax=Lomovskayavirus BT1 TaxID=225588 RepID=Q858Y6_9CAUD|nr:gp17 [Streptomyces phage phiBT1]CAD80139.1 gp17 [Lomovskayavirus BT1]